MFPSHSDRPRHLSKLAAAVGAKHCLTYINIHEVYRSITTKWWAMRLRPTAIYKALVYSDTDRTTQFVFLSTILHISNILSAHKG